MSYLVYLLYQRQDKKIIVIDAYAGSRNSSRCINVTDIANTASFHLIKAISEGASVVLSITAHTICCLGIKLILSKYQIKQTYANLQLKYLGGLFQLTQNDIVPRAARDN